MCSFSGINHRNPHFTSGSTTCFKPVFPINLPWSCWVSTSNLFPTSAFRFNRPPRRVSNRAIRLGSSALSSSSAACCWSGRTMPMLPLSKPLRGHLCQKRHHWLHRKPRRCPRFPRQERRPGWIWWFQGSWPAARCKQLINMFRLSLFRIPRFLKGDTLVGGTKPARPCPATELKVVFRFGDVLWLIPCHIFPFFNSEVLCLCCEICKELFSLQHAFLQPAQFLMWSSLCHLLGKIRTPGKV